MSQDRTDEAGDDLQACHGQHYRPEDRGEGRRQEEARKDGHPQVSVSSCQEITHSSLHFTQEQIQGWR